MITTALIIDKIPSSFSSLQMQFTHIYIHIFIEHLCVAMPQIKCEYKVGYFLRQKSSLFYIHIYIYIYGDEIFEIFFIELCWGKAMVAYTMPQERKKEESKQIKFIDLGF